MGLSGPGRAEVTRQEVDPGLTALGNVGWGLGRHGPASFPGQDGPPRPLLMALSLHPRPLGCSCGFMSPQMTETRWLFKESGPLGPAPSDSHATWAFGACTVFWVPDRSPHLPYGY